MKTNIGLNDKLIRMFLAAVFAVISLKVMVWAGLVSVILIATVILGWDPIYHITGFNSNRFKEA